MDSANLHGREPTLFVIPGSHACRSAMMMLDYKGIAFRTVQLHTGLHPLSVRVRGFALAGRPLRSVDGRTHRSLALLDRLGTVPALSIGGERVQTNKQIARHLDSLQPDPGLFPSDPERRAAVEEAERFGDEVLQMAARRASLCASSHGLQALHRRGGSGRLGPLLAPTDRRRAVAAWTAAVIFHAGAEREREVLDALPAMLDRVDAWIAAGVLGAPAPTVADFMIVPSLALLSYQEPLRSEIEARPAGALMERLLPEPALAHEASASRAGV
jgi:glutathione S-transferase